LESVTTDHVICADPERAWARLTPHLLDFEDTISTWTSQHLPQGPTFRAAEDQELRASGRYTVVTPEEAASLIEPSGPDGDVELLPLIAGAEPDVASETVELFVNKVIPHLRERLPPT
jgi:hypothetical protein